MIARVDVNGSATAISVDGVDTKAEFLARVQATGLPGSEAATYVHLWLPSKEWLAVTDWQAALSLVPADERQQLKLSASSTPQPPAVRFHQQLQDVGARVVPTWEAFRDAVPLHPQRAYEAFNQALAQEDEDEGEGEDEEDELLPGDAAELLVPPAPAVLPNPLKFPPVMRLGLTGVPLLLLFTSLVTVNSCTSHTGYGVTWDEDLPTFSALVGGLSLLFLAHASALFLDRLLPDVARSAFLHEIRKWWRRVAVAYCAVLSFAAGVSLAANATEMREECRLAHQREGEGGFDESVDCSLAPVFVGYMFGVFGTIASLPALAEDRATATSKRRTHIVSGCSERILHAPVPRATHAVMALFAFTAVSLMTNADPLLFHNVGAIAFWVCVLALMLELLLAPAALGRMSVNELCRGLLIEPRAVWIAVLVVEALFGLVLVLLGTAASMGIENRQTVEYACRHRWSALIAREQKRICGASMFYGGAATGLALAAVAGALLLALAVLRTAKAARADTRERADSEADNV